MLSGRRGVEGCRSGKPPKEGEKEEKGRERVRGKTEVIISAVFTATIESERMLRRLGRENMRSYCNEVSILMTDIAQYLGIASSIITT